jgi:predicted kinase
MARRVICGRPGSGKTTYVDSRRQINDFVWDWDCVAVTLFGTEELTAENRDVMEGLLCEAVRQVARAYKHNVWGIVTGRRWASDLARRLNAEVVVVDVPAAECVRRIESRDAPGARRDERLRVAKEWQ